MTIHERVVVVRKFPQLLHHRQRSDFFYDVSQCLDVDRPALVFDCSQLGHVDEQLIHLLLCCLEEAMKRHGDIRLAWVTAEMKASLKAVDADVLFRIFETSNAAVASFHGASTTLGRRETADRHLFTEFRKAI